MTEIIVTGGTFDKDYDPRTGEVSFDHFETSVGDILKTANALGHTTRVAMMIDSLDMTDEHRATVLGMCMASAHDRIVVTHGTDTMVETSQFLANQVVAQTIVLTGAMRPHRLGESDAAFNLGYALACAEALPSGVYVAMNGQVFTHDNVRKNHDTLRFETLG